MKNENSDCEFPEELQSHRFRETLYVGAKSFVDKLVNSDYNVLVFLDSGGRLFVPLIKSYWKKNYPNKKFPKIKFLNIGTEKQCYVEHEDMLRGVKNIYPKFGEGKIAVDEKILIVDEFVSTGETLKLARQLLQEAYPDNQVGMAALFRDFERGEPDLSLVNDPTPSGFPDKTVADTKILRQAPIANNQKFNVKSGALVADMTLIRKLLKKYFEIDDVPSVQDADSRAKTRLLESAYPGMMYFRERSGDPEVGFLEGINAHYNRDELEKLPPIIDDIIAETRAKTKLYGKYHEGMKRIGEGDF